MSVSQIDHASAEHTPPSQLIKIILMSIYGWTFGEIHLAPEVASFLKILTRKCSFKELSHFQQLLVYSRI